MTKWKLVPVEPTPEMDNAARDWSVSKYGRGIGNDAARGCYSAMLEAAPQQPKLSDEQIDKICDTVERDNVLFSQSGIYALARAIEREILGGGA